MNTSCEQNVEHTENGSDAIDAVSSDIEKMSISTDNKSVCANCGKEGSDVTNICNKCNMVKYCNAACKKKHRQKHKKACERRVAELHDEQLFKQPPPNEDCPICMVRLPSLTSGCTYNECCGKMICSGCEHAFQSRITKEEHDVCPFCRTPPPNSDKENVKRFEKRMELNDARAIFNMGCHYRYGRLGLPQSMAKALKLWHRAGELGNAAAYTNIGNAYYFGRGVEIDLKKARHYWELATMSGSVMARRNLGVLEEENVGNMERALKHYMIAVGGGDSISLNNVKSTYMRGLATKDDYAKALRSFQAYLDEIKTVQRDEAAAANDDNKYYESAS